MSFYFSTKTPIPGVRYYKRMSGSDALAYALILGFLWFTWICIWYSLVLSYYILAYSFHGVVLLCTWLKRQWDLRQERKRIGG